MQNYLRLCRLRVGEMTMTRIGVEQYSHTWHVEVEGGTGMTSRRKTVHVGDFMKMITALVEAWAEVNDREPLAILRDVGRVMVERENELMAKRDRAQSMTYDDLGNEQPPPALRRYPRRPKVESARTGPIPPDHFDELGRASTDDIPVHDPEMWGERETQLMSGLGSPGFEPATTSDEIRAVNIRSANKRENQLMAKPPAARRGPGRPRREPI